jgi:hypothetical protein
MTVIYKAAQNGSSRINRHSGQRKIHVLQDFDLPMKEQYDGFIRELIAAMQML